MLRRWAALSVHARLGRLALSYTGLGLLSLWVGGINGWTFLCVLGLMLVFGIANHHVRCPNADTESLQIAHGRGRRGYVRSVVNQRDNRRRFETDPLPEIADSPPARYFRFV